MNDFMERQREGLSNIVERIKGSIQSTATECTQFVNSVEETASGTNEILENLVNDMQQSRKAQEEGLETLSKNFSETKENLKTDLCSLRVVDQTLADGVYGLMNTHSISFKKLFSEDISYWDDCTIENDKQLKETERNEDELCKQLHSDLTTSYHREDYY